MKLPEYEDTIQKYQIILLLVYFYSGRSSTYTFLLLLYRKFGKKAYQKTLTTKAGPRRIHISDQRVGFFVFSCYIFFLFVYIFYFADLFILFLAISFSDFMPMLIDLILSHPGLHFLREAPQFYAKYAEVVKSR